MTSPAPSSSLPLGKALASTDKKTRDRAIKNLAAFLSENSDNEIPEHDMAKLWKGVFYCFWMSDKPLIQQALATELAELVLTITNAQSALAFLDGFWRCMVREWSGIDVLRLDKYLMLVRRFVNASLRLLGREKWNSKYCKAYNEILSSSGGPLCPTDIKVPSGLTYHLSDVFIEELDKVLIDTSPSDKPAPICLLLEPFLALCAQTLSKVTFKRVQTSVLEPVIAAYSEENSAREDEKERPSKRSRMEKDTTYSGLGKASCLWSADEGRLDRPQILKGLRRAIFEVAGQHDTKDASRRKLYALCKEIDVDSDEE